MNLKVTIQNGKQVSRLYSAMPAFFQKNLNVATERSIKVIQRNAMREAPVNKQKGGGNLRQSIRSRMIGKTRGEIEVGAKYGIFVHEGTRPHIIRATRKKVLANRRSGAVFGKTVRHPGTKPNRFLDRAIDQSNNQVNREFNKAIERSLKELTG